MKPTTFLTALSAMLLAATSWLSAAERTPTHFKSSAKDTVHRASKINGMEVKNKAHKQLGEVQDIVIDVTSGDVQYLAVSYGGLLGVGNKLFAIPLDVFQLRRAEGEHEYFLMLDVDEATLKAAPGFDEDQWPNFADKKWTDGINAYYGKHRREHQADGGARLKVRANDSGVSVDVTKGEQAKEDRKDSSTARDTIHRISKVTGMTVMNAADKELGEVDDLVIDMAQGKVRYVALSYGGLLGVGDKLFAVPFEAFDCRPSDEENEYYLVVNIDEATLKNAPASDKDRWPNFADPRWSDELDRHYGTDNRRAERIRKERRER